MNKKNSKVIPSVIGLIGGIMFMCCSCIFHKVPLEKSEVETMLERANEERQMKFYEELINDSLASPTKNPQGLCCLSDWALDNDKSNYVAWGLNPEIYNAYSFLFSISSDYEIWARAHMTESEPLVSTDSIVNAIKQINSKPLGSFQKYGENFRTEIIWLMNHTDEWSHDGRNPNAAFNKFDESMYPSMIIKDSARLEHYFYLVDSLLEKYDYIQKEIASIKDDSKKFDAILEKIESTNDFEKKCAIALVCSSNYSTCMGVQSLELMASLLNSGKYSILLERMWIVWRAISQWLVVGQSRDAVIPNYNYNKVKKNIYMSIINHLKENPSDEDAAICGYVIISDINILRNGSCMYGNEAMIDLMTYCPNFWKNPE